MLPGGDWRLQAAARKPLNLLVVAMVLVLLPACGSSQTSGTVATPSPSSSPVPTCSSVLLGAGAINLEAAGFAYLYAFPTGTVGTTPAVTASGAGLFTVQQFTACTSGNTVDGVQAFLNTQLPALPHGWMTSSTFPADGGLMQSCAAPWFFNPKGGPYYYFVFDHFSAHAGGVITYRARWAVFDLATLPACIANFNSSTPGAQQAVYFVGSGATALPVPPLSSIASDNASGGLRGYDICSPGTAASVTAFMEKEVPADGWTKVTTNDAHCTISSNCWSKDGQYWSWGSISDPTLWRISYRQYVP